MTHHHNTTQIARLRRDITIQYSEDTSYEYKEQNITLDIYMKIIHIYSFFIRKPFAEIQVYEWESFPNSHLFERIVSKKSFAYKNHSQKNIHLEGSLTYDIHLEESLTNDIH